MFLNGKKILYHGTIYQHDVIDLSKCKKYGDFGAGYYLTTLFNQAYTWAKNKSHGNYYVYKYILHQFPQNNIRILPLLQYNLEWLNTIAYCRLYGTIPHEIQIRKNIRNPNNYDIVYDRMADNIGSELGKLVFLYTKKELPWSYVLPRISQNWQRDQYCFKTQKAINLLRREAVFKF